MFINFINQFNKVNSVFNTNLFINKQNKYFNFNIKLSKYHNFKKNNFY